MKLKTNQTDMKSKLSIINYQLTIILTLALLFSLPAKAQVNIGSQDPPQQFSVLELNSNNKGLRLPQFETTKQRDDISDLWDATAKENAKGLVIFNKETKCLEFWNGSEWISLCATVLPDPSELPIGSGNLEGRTCFDIAESVCDGLQPSTRVKTDFAIRTVQDITSSATYSGVQTYKFTATTANVSNVRYQLVASGSFSLAQLVDLTNTPVTGTLEVGALANGSFRELVIYYKDNLNTLLLGVPRNAVTLTLYIIYYDGMANVSVPLIINLQDCACCGAFVEAGVWKAFMCHNLGADYSADPFEPSMQINGAYYRFGDKTPCANPPHINDNLLITWVQSAPPGTYGSAATDHTTKTDYDPCPPGYRVHSYDEWSYLHQNNARVNKGTWSTGNYCGSMFGTALFLPTAGHRLSSNGGLSARGAEGNYWSSREYGSVNAYSMDFTSSFATAENRPARWTGQSVRCIAE